MRSSSEWRTNQRRRHSTIDYLSPAQFERQATRNSAAELDGALGGSHTLAPAFLAQATERLHNCLPPLTNEIEVTMNPNDVS